MAFGSRVKSTRDGFSTNALVVNVIDPNNVPLMVCGLRNFQNDDKNSPIFSSPPGLCPSLDAVPEAAEASNLVRHRPIQSVPPHSFQFTSAKETQDNKTTVIPFSRDKKHGSKSTTSSSTRKDINQVWIPTFIPELPLAVPLPGLLPNDITRWPRSPTMKSRHTWASTNYRITPHISPLPTTSPPLQSPSQASTNIPTFSKPISSSSHTHPHPSIIIPHSQTSSKTLPQIPSTHSQAPRDTKTKLWVFSLTASTSFTVTGLSSEKISLAYVRLRTEGERGQAWACFSSPSIE